MESRSWPSEPGSKSKELILIGLITGQLSVCCLMQERQQCQWLGIRPVEGAGKPGGKYQASLSNDHISREALAILSVAAMESNVVLDSPMLVTVTGYQDRRFPWCPRGVHVR